MTQERGSVLITGAGGNLGGILHQDLTLAGWRVRSLVRTDRGDLAGEVVVANVTDLAAMERACEGVDAVMHMGGISVPGLAWEDYLNTNIHGTRTVLEAAHRAGVGRVALASSNHAVGYARRRSANLSSAYLPANISPRPDSYYGVSKAAMEALGSYYADEFGLKTTSLRIGSCFPVPTTWRQLSTWLSRGDLLRLVEAALTGPWGGHSTVWGISRNTRRWWSLVEGERIGYFPEDDAEKYAEGMTPEASDFAGGSVPPYLWDMLDAVSSEAG